MITECETACWVAGDSEGRPFEFDPMIHWDTADDVDLDDARDQADSDDVQAVQLKHPCWKGECDYCGEPVTHFGEDGEATHFPGSGDATDSAVGLDWTTDGTSWHCPECRRLAPGAPETCDQECDHCKPEDVHGCVRPWGHRERDHTCWVAS